MRPIFSLLVITAVSCASGRSAGVAFYRVRYAPTEAPLTPGQEVELITVGPPARPFVEIATLETENGISALRAYASRFGCDALFLLAPAVSVSSGVPLFGTRYVSSDRIDRATCITYMR